MFKSRIETKTEFICNVCGISGKSAQNCGDCEKECQHAGWITHNSFSQGLSASEIGRCKNVIYQAVSNPHLTGLASALLYGKYQNDIGVGFVNCQFINPIDYLFAQDEPKAFRVNLSTEEFTGETIEYYNEGKCNIRYLVPVEEDKYYDMWLSIPIEHTKKKYKMMEKMTTEEIEKACDGTVALIAKINGKSMLVRHQW